MKEAEKNLALHQYGAVSSNKLCLQKPSGGLGCFHSSDPGEMLMNRCQLPCYCICYPQVNCQPLLMWNFASYHRYNMCFGDWQLMSGEKSPTGTSVPTYNYEL